MESNEKRIPEEKLEQVVGGVQYCVIYKERYNPKDEETPEMIANKYSVPIELLLQVNHIKPGQRLMRNDQLTMPVMWTADGTLGGAWGWDGGNW